ncbi:hypothetical protein D3C77_669940 [compost metagenome]
MIPVKCRFKELLLAAEVPEQCLLAQTSGSSDLLRGYTIVAPFRNQIDRGQQQSVAAPQLANVHV